MVIEHHVRGDVGQRPPRAWHVVKELLEVVQALPHLVAEERAGRVLGRLVALDAEGFLAGPPRRGQAARQEAERWIGTRGRSGRGAKPLVGLALRTQKRVRVGLGPEAGPSAAVIVVDIVPLFVDVCVGEVGVDRACRARGESPRLIETVRSVGDGPQGQGRPTLRAGICFHLPPQPLHLILLRLEVDDRRGAGLQLRQEIGPDVGVPGGEVHRRELAEPDRVRGVAFRGEAADAVHQHQPTSRGEVEAVERVGVLGPRLRVGQRDLLTARAGARDQAVPDLGASLHQLCRRRVRVDLIAGQPELL